MIIRLIKYFGKYKIYAIICPILMLVEVLCDVFMPYLAAKIVDKVGDNVNELQTIKYIVYLGLLMVGLALLALFCGALSSKLAAIASQGAGSEIRYDLFKKIQTFSFSDLDKFSVPSLITRLTADISNLQMAGMMSLRMLIRAPFMLLFALILAISMNPGLSTVFLIAIPILSISLYFIMSRAMPRFKNLQTKLDELNASIQENLTNIRIVKSFVREDHEKKKFKNSNDNLTGTAIKAVKLVILNMPIMQLVIYGCIISILWLGSGLVLDTNIKEILTGVSVTTGMHAGELISFITYVTQILVSLMMISFLFLMFVRAKASADRVFEVLDTNPDIFDPQNAIEYISDGSVEFKNVSFRYAGGSGEDTLSNINISIKYL